MPKTRTLIYLQIATLALLTCNNNIYAMLVARAHNVTVTHRLIQQRPNAEAAPAALADAGSQKVLWQPEFSAIERGDLPAVKTNLRAWRYTLLPWHYYGQAVADCLCHAARFSAENTGPIADYLLKRVETRYITDPETLLAHAVDHNHTGIIKYVEKKFGEHLTAHALDCVIATGKAPAFQALLSADVNHESTFIYRNGPTALERALKTFNPHDTAETTSGRLLILNRLLKLSNATAIPAGFEARLCGLPEFTKNKIVGLLQKYLIPARVCMSDDAPTIHDASVGTALTEQDGLNQGQPSFFMSPLHQAAAKKDYAACLAILTEFQDPIRKDDIFPREALLITKTASLKETKVYNDAVQTIAAFTVRMTQKLLAECAHSKRKRLQVDAQGLTAQDIARSAKAPQELIDLLDPYKHEPLRQAIGKKLEKIFTENGQKIKLQFK